MLCKILHLPVGLNPRKPASLLGLPPGIIDISALGYNARAVVGAQAAKNCNTLQFTNQANFHKRFSTKLLETYRIHKPICRNILSNFVSVGLEQSERLGFGRLGGEPFYPALLPSTYSQGPTSHFLAAHQTKVEGLYERNRLPLSFELLAEILLALQMD